MRNVKNPILRGFHPDPSIVRVGENYYVAVSTFEWYPGVAIYCSENLSDWKFAASPLTEEKIDLRGIDSACGVWAPNLTYYKGTFYLLYTIVYTNRSRYKDTHNFLITASQIEGPWSEPVYLNCSGFDPSLFHDANGKKWLINMTIDHRVDKERFSGIDIQEYDEKRQKLIGPVYRIFKGTQIGTTEGPNILKRGEYYYLTCAEGGTEFGHCVTVARAKSIIGPYEVNPDNPMLSSKAESSYPIQRAGHGQLVEDGKGRWYMAHLCSRPVDGYSILGRETAIQNIMWTDSGWFRLQAGGKLPQLEFQTEEKSVEMPVCTKTGREDFEQEKLPWEFFTLRESAKKNGITVSERKGWVRIYGGNSLSSKYKQGLLARRQQDFYCDFTVKMQFCPKRYQHMAGIVCYYNYDNYYYMRVTKDENLGVCICITSVENGAIAETECVQLPQDKDIYYLRAKIRRENLEFFYSVDEEVFHKVGEILDMRILSDEHVDGNGFTGAMLGMSCQDLQGDGCYADFDWVDYVESYRNDDQDRAYD